MAILAVGALWFLFHKSQVAMSQQQDPATNAPTVTSIAIQSSAGNSTAHVDTNSNVGDTNIIADITTKYNQGLIGKDQVMQAVILEENKKSLDIYGKVVDQYGNPVSGAKVQGSIGVNVSFVESGGEFRYTETDSQGLFNFLGIHGTGIGISPQKEGYFYNQRILPGRPKDYSPDPNNPLVFTMWKIHGPELLVNSGIDAKILHDGSATTFDIATGKETVDGDLRVTLSRFPLEVKRSRNRFDWAVKIEMLRGGLVEEKDPYPYWAPQNGYAPSFEFNVSSNSVPWQNKLEQDFYIKNSQGRYGKMKFGIYSALTPARLQINFTINPSGSQNLEPDFSK